MAVFRNLRNSYLDSYLTVFLYVQRGVPVVDGYANGFPDTNLIVTRATKTTTGEKASTGLSLLNAFSCQGTVTGLILQWRI